MKLRHPFVQAVVLIAVASLIAVVANGFAGRTRKLVLKGYYPNALKVPPRTPAQVPPPVAAATPGTTMQSPAPGAAPLPVPTATIERPAATATAPATTTAAQPLPPAATGTVAAAPGDRPPAAASPAPAPAPAPDLSRFQPHPDKAYVELNGDDVVALHRGGALFLDARRTSVYEQGHIAGARSYSVWEADIDDKVNALYAERNDPRDQNLPIVIYCSGGACEDSHMLAQKLWGVQFNNVYVYKDGYPDWEKRNGPTKTGAQP